jgi:hypothetical protein
MRRLCIGALAAGSLMTALSAETVDQRLQWVRETIDSHATTRYFEPSRRSSEVKWHVTQMEGCSVELKQILHRDAPASLVTGDGVFGVVEDKTVSYKFDLHALQPRFVMADTSAGLPQVKIFAAGDVFHLNTESVSKTVREDGSVVETNTWSNPGNARNLWIYFDSPDADNKLIVKKVESELREAIGKCAGDHHHHR